MSDSQKQIVQWFPGHMAKTRRQIKETLHMVDAVAEVLDARIPRSSRNPEIDELVGSKPRIILLNKKDLADEKATALWVKHFNSLGSSALAVDCQSGSNLGAFRPLVRSILADVIKANEQKGMPGKYLRIMVVGIPNTGKSSFINRMAGASKAEVANKPGVTKQNRWFNIGSGIELLDTPGVLWPKFDDPAVGDKIAFIGSIRSEVIDPEIMAMRLLDVLARDYRELLVSRYKLEDIDGLEAYEILEAVARKRGMVRRGGETDTERAAKTVLDEYRSGKLGRITLERP